MMKLPRIILGTILAIAGIACYVAGGYTFVKAYQADSAVDAQAERLAEQCRKQLSGFAKVRSRPDKTVVVELGDVKDPRSTLADMATVTAMCPFQPLVEACIGTDCGKKPGSAPTATLTLSAPIR